MGDIRVGTASWTDRTLLESGWYPPSADTPEKRLAYYAEHFPLVEVDSTYYAPPSERTAALWAERTPPGFVFNIKAFSLLTGHPTRPAAIYKDLRPDTDKKNLYPHDLPAQAYEEAWVRFLSALDPLVQAGKLGVILFQFPPWFTIRRSNKEYLVEVAQRCAPLRVAVELRHESWFHGDNYVGQVEAEGTGDPIRLPGNGTARIRFTGARAHDDAGRSTITTAPRPDLGMPNLRGYGFAGDFEGHVTYGLGIQVAPGSDQLSMDLVVVRIAGRCRSFLSSVAHGSGCPVWCGSGHWCW